MNRLPFDAARFLGGAASVFTISAFARCLALVCAAVGMAVLPARTQAQGVSVGGRSGGTFGFLNDSVFPFVSAEGDVEANTNVRLDFHAGVYVVVPVDDRYSLQPELLFVQKGAHFSRSGPGRYISERYRLSYLQGQILGRRTIPISGPLSLHAVAGLSVDRALGGAVRRDVRSVTLVFEERIGLLENDLIRHWDIGGVLGVGLGYAIGSTGTVALELRYNPGFASVFTRSTPPEHERPEGLGEIPTLSSSPPSLRHDVITASISYTVALGR